MTVGKFPLAEDSHSFVWLERTIVEKKSERSWSKSKSQDNAVSIDTKKDARIVFGVRFYHPYNSVESLLPTILELHGNKNSSPFVLVFSARTVCWRETSAYMIVMLLRLLLLFFYKLQSMLLSIRPNSFLGFLFDVSFGDFFLCHGRTFLITLHRVWDVVKNEVHEVLR